MKLRAYALVNQYIAGIHAGIQTAHALVRLSVKYDPLSQFYGQPAEMYNDWRNDHETLIVLNGGYQQRIYETMELWEKCDFPFAHFCEEQEALNGALTAAVIILPEYIYAHRPADPEDNLYAIPDSICEIIELTPDEMAVNRAMQQFRLKGE